MSIEELSSRGSPACQEAFAYLREQLKAEGNVEETVEYEPLKETEAPSYNVRETPRVRVFFGEKLEVFLYIPEKAVPKKPTKQFQRCLERGLTELNSVG